MSWPEMGPGVQLLVIPLFVVGTSFGFARRTGSARGFFPSLLALSTSFIHAMITRQFVLPFEAVAWKSHQFSIVRSPGGPDFSGSHGYCFGAASVVVLGSNFGAPMLADAAFWL